ncbi:hypothetical protein GCM10010172_14900 [Paractinoplanes ferrugineus]|uniref:DUF4265 domain-containing protein n=1 Tax=Paractinoplanes ferrugineus TaxID=113564 RepID=A0A919IX31_9ACTN|nr:DUF4265 domain-containing protein [Actinoplanes ferrugineus]GIE10055.1 hypothetical protein Afe05nite_18950 [Actinoplanes ferrugineus]
MHQQAKSDLVRVLFSLDVDEDGWPPVSAETMWARVLSPDRVEIDNVPFFVRGLSSGDEVRVVRDDDGMLVGTEVIEWAGHCTVRVVPFPGGPLAGNLQRVLDAFAPLGITGEGIEHFGLIALDIPPDADLQAVIGLLRYGFEEGWWDYEEGNVSEDWRSAG